MPLLSRMRRIDSMARRAYDFYPTGQQHAIELLERLPFKLSGKILEPCVGTGDIAIPLRGQGLEVVTNDIDATHEADFHFDATRPETWGEFPEVDFIVTNPPFNFAPAILPLAHQKAQMGIIFLLRLSYSEPCGNRADWMRKHQHEQSILYPSNRISFTGDRKTDKVATAWFVWGKGARLCVPFVYPESSGQGVLFSEDYLETVV